ncbi:hypothetical protein PR202_ga20929 [Eleusine coracana subsp. coracana]|uniref:Uncharacterized protein n=1 Tax=Eleusine coracana subsp. coracana TaxID=191504 RepID=A0AAV5CZU6_ELECO|nr:hypothetical protein PR202_ga20929 [Eleusine coracana subsp. coracana]
MILGGVASFCAGRGEGGRPLADSRTSLNEEPKGAIANELLENIGLASLHLSSFDLPFVNGCAWGDKVEADADACGEGKADEFTAGEVDAGPWTGAGVGLVGGDVGRWRGGSGRGHSQPIAPEEQELSINRFFSRMHKTYKRTLRKATLISLCDIRSAVVNSMFYALLLKLVRVSLGYLTVFPSVRLEQGVPHRRSRLAKLYKTGTAPTTGLHNKTLASTELLGDLISFGDDTDGKEHSGMTSSDSVNSQDNKAPPFDGDLMELLYTPQDNRKKEEVAWRR